MRFKFILPALTEATSPFFRPIKYSLFPPLGLATLAAHLPDDCEATIEDEHVTPVRLDDDPDVVAIEVYITNARRAYAIADHYRRRGVRVCLGGLHVTSLPAEAKAHADSIFLGPGEDTWPAFLADLRAGRPRPVYSSKVRTLVGAPQPRRDLFDAARYLVPNSLVVSRGCPHSCDFCYKTSFFAGGRSFYTAAVDEALAEIESLRGRHLFFLDDNLFADRRFAMALFEGMRGMGRVWQAAGTVRSVLDGPLLDAAARCGLSSLFVGFETLNDRALAAHNKGHNSSGDYDRAAAALRGAGVMINGSFVFGSDEDEPSAFDRTVDWAVSAGIETATFHILTPYPGTALHGRLSSEGRLLAAPWDLYDTRHAVFTPARMSAAELNDGYRRAYSRFYSWGNILKAAAAKGSARDFLRHVAYAGAWKKLEPLWGAIIRTGMLAKARPVLEKVLDGFTPRPTSAPRPCRRSGVSVSSWSCGPEIVRAEGISTGSGWACRAPRP